MSALWFDAALAGTRPDACWELYHENSKRGRRLRTDVASGPAPPGPSYEGFPTFALAEPPKPERARQSPAAGGNGSLPLQALSDLLASGCRPLGEADPVEAFVLVNAVESLPDGLFHYRPAAPALRLLRRSGITAEVAQAFPAPDLARRARAVIFLAGNLAAAAHRGGERGYRDALIFAGRHLMAIGVAASAAGCRIEEVGDFYDRDIDALLSLDGLARSVLAIVAVAG